MLCYPYLLRGPKKSGNATSPVHSQGSPTLSAGSKITNGHQQTGTKLEVATLPMHCLGPEEGRECYVTPALLGIPKAQCADPNQKWAPTKGNKFRNGCLTLSSKGPKKGQKCYVSLAFLGIPNAQRRKQNEKRSPTNETKMRSGCVTPAFSEAQKRVKMLRHPCILGDAQHQAHGGISRVAASPLPFR